MADYIKRESAISIADTGYYDIHDIRFALKTIPGLVIVRCRDCKHRDPEGHKCDCGQLERAGCVFPVDDDYFCAYGEIRNG